MKIADVYSPNAVRAAAPSIFLAVLIVGISIKVPEFASARSILAVLSDAAPLALLAAGLTFVILIGAIDLSVQAVASLSSVIAALLVPRFGFSGFALALAGGLASGLLSGVAYVKLQVPSFIATLASGGIVTGVALYLSKAATITIDEESRTYFDWVNGTILGVPGYIAVSAIVLAVCFVIQNYTRFGRYSLAIGSGEAAAWAAGVKVPRQKIVALALCGLLAALVGVLLAGRQLSGSPTLANELLLPSIAAVLVGGTAITGGVGGIGQTIIGALIVSVIRIGMTFLGINIFAQQIVFGVFLILAVGLTIDRTKLPFVK
jgi:ribose transport system permease protein